MAGGISNNDDSGTISDINVTPFVDVVLVLLVIFMVTAPMMMRDSIQVKLPQASNVDTTVQESLGIVVTKDGTILVNGQPATPESVKAEVTKTLAANPNAQAIIAADSEARHGAVVQAIDLVKGAGLTRFAIQIDRGQVSGADAQQPASADQSSGTK